MISRPTAVCCTLAAALVGLAFPATARALEIYSDFNDGFLEVRDILPPEGQWPQVHPNTIAGLPGHNAGDSWSANVGEWFGPGLTTIVLPFQLPNLGTLSNPFTSANFSVMVHEKGTATFTDVDLYAVRTDADPAIAASDWYLGSSIDPTATLIQKSFLTPSSPAGFVGAPNNSTDATGDANLLGYLNAAYAGGAGAGDYVFLRLSYAGDTFAAGWDAYKITLREAAQQGEWPVITVATDAVMGDTNGNGTVEFEPDFGPIRDNWLETNATFGMQLARTDGDLNLDGEVSIGDFREWKNAYLSMGGSAEHVLAAARSLSVAIPEPTALLMAGIGLTVFAARRRTHA
jgi:hypothetical protein